MRWPSGDGIGEIDGARFASGTALLLAIVAIVVPYFAGIVFALASVGFAARLVHWRNETIRTTGGSFPFWPILSVLAFAAGLALFFIGPGSLERVRSLLLALSAVVLPASSTRRAVLRGGP